MRIGVTGAAGQVGSDLIPAIAAASHEPVAWTRATLDVTDISSVKRALAQVGPDLVIHAAAYTAVDRAEEEPAVARAVNVEGTANVAAVCAARRVPIFYLSTDYVFDGAGRAPYPPDQAPGPLNVYGLSKLEGENRVRSSGAEFLIVRSSWVYGAHGANFVKTILRLARECEVLHVVQDQIGSPTWSRTLAGAVVQLGTAGARGVLHVTDRTLGGDRQAGISRYDFASAILREMGITTPVKPIELAASSRPARRPAYCVLDISETERRLGRSMPCWRDSLRGMLGELGHRPLEGDSAEAAMFHAVKVRTEGPGSQNPTAA
jgi:dTDP-4-dehydrorhamnose reductase